MATGTILQICLIISKFLSSDWSAVDDQPLRPSGSVGAPRGRRDARGSSQAVPRTDPHPLGQLSSEEFRLRTSRDQSDCRHQGLGGLYVSSESDRSAGVRRHHARGARAYTFDYCNVMLPR